MTRLQALANRIETQFADPTVKFFTERRKVTENQERRRVVFVHAAGKVAIPSGGRAGAVLTASNEKKLAPYEREEVIEIHVVAEDSDALDVLLERLIVAFNLVDGKAALTWRWKTQEAGADGHALRSQALVMNYVAHWPVVENLAPLRPIVSDETTVYFTDDP